MAMPNDTAGAPEPGRDWQQLVERLERAQQADVGSVLEACVRFSGLAQRTPTERVLRAVQEELRDLTERAAAALLHGSCSELATERLRALFAQSAVAADSAEFPEAALRALCVQLPRADAERVSRWLQEHTQFQARLQWLLEGTSDAELLTLDPLQDCDRIHHRLARAFRVESRILETLAINRVAQSTALLGLIRSTRRAEEQPVQRFQDTYSLLANFFEWGEHSRRGREAASRIREIHGRYNIANDGMKYVLLQTAFTWLDGAQRIAHRPVHEIERRGLFHALVKLGRAIHVSDITDDWAQMYAWYQAFNEANRAFHPQKRLTFQRIVGNSLRELDSEPLKQGIQAALLAGMDATYLSAIGEPEPSPDELAAVRAVLFTLGTAAEQLPQPVFIRSLQNNPARSAYTQPNELGAPQRSAWMPQAEPGQPVASAPQTQPGQPASEPAELPVKTWTEIRQHTSLQSLWVVVEGYVYDLTAFALAHPGGVPILLEHAGKDATLAYRAAPHSALTHVFRQNFRIARVE
jgi:hypothetical protein